MNASAIGKAIFILSFFGEINTCVTPALADSNVIVAQQFHILNENEEHPREPWGGLWRSQNPEEFDKHYGGPLRLSLHTTTEGDFFPTLIPVHADNSIDGDRLRAAGAAKASTEFAPENRLRLDQARGTIWARLENAPEEVQVGKLIGPKRAYFCTGPYKERCSVGLRGRVVVLRHPSTSAKLLVEYFPLECPAQNVAEVLSSTQSIEAPSRTVQPTLMISVIFTPGNGTSCEELRDELQGAVSIFGRSGIRLKFTPFSHQKARFDAVYLDTVPTPDKPDLFQLPVGEAVPEKHALVLGQVPFRRRPRLVLAHEIGHMLGLEHETTPNNLMSGKELTDSNQELNEAQTKKMKRGL